MIANLPRLVAPRMAVPTCLRQATAGLPLGDGLSMDVEPKHLAEARNVVASFDGKPKTVPRHLIVALLRLFQDEKVPRQRSVIVWMILQADSIPWRRLWMLWELCSEHRQQLAPRLAKRIYQRAKQSEKFRERLPQWLPMTGVEELENALMESESPIQKYCEWNLVALHELPGRVQLMDSSDIGNRAIVNLIKNGSARWWMQMSVAQIRDWATERGNLALTIVTANRLLCEAGGTASRPGMLQRSTENSELVRWVLNTLGDPIHHKGVWEQMSERACEVFEWLLLVDEFEKILAEFRRYAEDDRADYWARKFEEVRDARFYQAKDSVICMMIIGELLIIEFGTKANACYVYDAWLPPRLRSLQIKNRVWAKDFKQKAGLRISSTDFDFRKSLTHMSGWQFKFDQYFQMNA